MICLGAGIPACIPAAALGAVIPDLDVLFRRIFADDPRRYLFSHGGITHSLAGSVLMAISTFLGVSAIVSVIPGYSSVFPAWDIPALLACVGGALTHVFFDLLAYPGIPVLAPFDDRKFTLGIFPGPSLVLLAMSTFFTTLFLLGGDATVLITLYAPVFAGTILLRTTLKGLIAFTTSGKTIPTFNPFRWILLREDQNEYRVSILRFPGGEHEALRSPKYSGLQAGEEGPAAKDPRVLRLKYYSYFVTVERTGDTILFRDPVREEGVIFYPPVHTRVTIPAFSSCQLQGDGQN